MSFMDTTPAYRKRIGIIDSGLITLDGAILYWHQDNDTTYLVTYNGVQVVGDSVVPRLGLMAVLKPDPFVDEDAFDDGDDDV